MSRLRRFNILLFLGFSTKLSRLRRFENSVIKKNLKSQKLPLFQHSTSRNLKQIVCSN